MQRLFAGLAVLVSLLHLPFAALAQDAPAPMPDDAYISGYVAAIVRDVFSLDHASVSVSNGAVTVVCHYLDQGESGNLTRIVSKCRGVQSVRVLFEGQADASPDSLPGNLQPIVPDRFTLFPERTLFRPLLADPRWPRFAATTRHVIDNPDYGQLAGIDIGATMPLARYTAASGRRYEVGFQGSVFSVFNPDMPETALMNTDFIVSLPIAYRFDRVSTLFRLSHQSTHLGDEYIKFHPTNVIEKLSFEYVNLLASYDTHYNCRMYAGFSYRFAGEPANYDPMAIRLGFEARMRRAFLGDTVRPLLAFDILSQQENNWTSDLTTRAGFEIQSTEAPEYRLQFLLEYYDGHMIDGQFYDDRVRYWGMMLAVAFQ